MPDNQSSLLTSVGGSPTNDIDQTKNAYNSLQENLKIFFDDLLSQRISLELQVIEAKKFKLAVDSASDHIIITDATGLILYANKAVEKITGYSFAEVVGKQTDQLWGSHRTKDLQAKIKVAISSGETFKGEANNTRKDGTPYITQLSVSSVTDEKGEILFLVEIERDITKEKEVDQMKSEFISLTSHQLRTPLTGIRWFTEILLHNQEKNLSAEQLGFIQQISDSNQRMIKLVNDILDISHIETGRKFEIKKEMMSMNDVIKEILTENISLIKSKNLQIENKIPDSLKVWADVMHTKQVWQNLISNATKYTPENKKITIYVETSKKTTENIFAIKDEGIGIPEQQKGRLFEKFFRADNAATQDPNGTGLGLYIARELVRAQGGEMWLETKENKGTTFYFSLPTA